MRSTPTVSETAAGVRVITEEVPSVRSVALGLWVRTGSRDETPAQAGVSHFLEHLLFKGTPNYSAIEISERFDGLGASFNAATGKESTHLHARFLDEHTGDVFSLLGEMLLESTFPDIDSERDVVLEEIAMYEDEPSDRVHDYLADAIFGDTPLGRRILGQADVISNVPVPDIAAYHAARYTADNIVVAAAGNVDHDEIVAMAEALKVAPGNGEETLVPAGPARQRAARVRGQGHRAVPRLLRRARDQPGRRAALRARRARLDPRRVQLVRGFSGRSGRSAAWPTRSGPTPSSTPTPAWSPTYVGTREDNVEEACEVIGTELREDPVRAGQRRRTRPGQGARQGPAGPLRRVDRGPDGADRPGQPPRPAVAHP